MKQRGQLRRDLIGPLAIEIPLPSISSCWHRSCDVIPSLYGRSLILGGAPHVLLYFSPATITRSPVLDLTEQESGFSPFR